MKKLLLLSALLLVSVLSKAQSEAFEGEMSYENTVTSSKGMKRLFPSLLKDGTYEMQFVIKGKKRKISDTYAGLVQYENRDRDMAYVYSPLLKKGFKFSISDYEKKLEKRYKDGGGKPAKKTGEVKDFDGLTCHHYKGTSDITYDLLGAKIVVNCTLDYWICKDFPPEYMGSIPVEGMPMSFDEMQVAQFPLLGSQKQHQNVQMTKVERRAVDNSEVTPPSGVQFEISEDAISSMMKLQKEISKHMKKNNIEDTGVDIHHGKTEDPVIDDAWD